MTDGEQLCFLLTVAVLYFLHLTPEVVLIKYARLGSVKRERGVQGWTFRLAHDTCFAMQREPELTCHDGLSALSL